ncbi:hypothetical protein B9Z55_020851 [Caenorhabditis nigoni]|uniref:BTB domain-containing protein n=1 Tax=Caenorhabditis nigoni TaxID=1611254 RepID=A0A2G5TPE4_9PELO|nr:hypothetical protein B9Z55_020851 [Caenorhabditis nigoni]
MILVVDGRKFYVSKTYLSYQSRYFANLFSEASKDSGRSEMELKDVNPEDLQYYLDILYGGNGIDVNGILVIAKMYNTPLVLHKCEEFLIEKSELELRKKLELAGKYGLDELKKLCLDRIITKEDILSVLPENINKMDHESMAEILKKTLALI